MSQNDKKMIHVFKTSVKTRKDIKQLKPYLEESFGQSNWNFDLEDCDNILRVESENENKFLVSNLLQNFNFDCEELPD